MKRQALIVIDVQNDYFPGGKWEQAGMDAAAANVAALLAHFRARQAPVVHIRHEFPSEDAPFFTPGSEGAAIHPTAAPAPGEPVLLKHHINSFRDTPLLDTLKEHSVEEVVICGAMSHMCVDACTRAANDFGFAVTVVHDACASRDLEFDGVRVPAAHAHAAFMAALGFAYARMSSAGQFIDTVH
ncbi:cysteine hydrolase family protein [Pseudoduganella umbonata]|uniref:Cysteine hydrolase n=1 Tax=Pseudoduganella umbonata TaxID=864828 RepID=A0A4P8HIE1_9BURK|nr:cysteine hydrolase family protein [Pseudoduganella umbonata]MBB3225167.1 nicotinamidase-related amidase [Pseudoduganella umbonata]QCP09303.1 cysteine hydrolase [Pseudoduganella umbonata]